MEDFQGHLEASLSVNQRDFEVNTLSIIECTPLGHVVPEARLGGPIALVKDGDRIVVDSEHRAINWLVDEAEQDQRKQEWDASDKGQLTEKRGVLFRYARDVAVSPRPDALYLPLSYFL
jgi:hypothetical protein